jgi:hypothetical protein
MRGTLNFKEADIMVFKASVERCRKAAKVMRDAVYNACPVGTISRPMYKSGPYAEVKWTARDEGQLKKSVRVVEQKEEQHGWNLARFHVLGSQGIVRVYAGNFLAYYARIVELCGLLSSLYGARSIIYWRKGNGKRTFNGDNICGS